jgi:benzoylsuccinyl-CoA thiolase BbsA subunit
MSNEKNPQKKKKEKEPDITFYHPDLFEIPEDGSSPLLKGYRCKKCGQLDFPKVSPCPACWGDEFEIVPLSTKGKLYSYATLIIGQPGMDVPYTVGYVDLPENIRIFSQLEPKGGEFQCEDEMELTTGVIRLNRDGLPITSYKFKKSAPKH